MNGTRSLSENGEPFRKHAIRMLSTPGKGSRAIYRDRGSRYPRGNRAKFAGLIRSLRYYVPCGKAINRSADATVTRVEIQEASRQAHKICGLMLHYSEQGHKLKVQIAVGGPNSSSTRVTKWKRKKVYT